MGPDQRLERLYAEHADAVLRYLRRRIAPDVADEALSDTFLVAWRRLDEVPPGDSALPWLLAVARRLLANERRAAGRRIRLLERLRGEAPTGVQVPADAGLGVALASLSPAHREILLLIAWTSSRPPKRPPCCAARRSRLAAACTAPVGRCGLLSSGRMYPLTSFTVDPSTGKSTMNPADPIDERLAAADPLSGRDLNPELAAGWARVQAHRPVEVRRPAIRRHGRLAGATLALAGCIAVAPALLPSLSGREGSGGRAGAVLPDGPVAAFAATLERPGILHAVTETAERVGDDGTRDREPTVQNELFYAVDGSRWRQRMTVNSDEVTGESTFDGTELRTYNSAQGLLQRFPAPARPDPEGPQDTRPFAARTLDLAERLARGDYRTLGPAEVRGEPATVIGLDAHPNDTYEIDQRLSVSRDRGTLLRVDTLDLPMPNGTVRADWRWQRDEVLTYEILPSTPKLRDRLLASKELRGDQTPFDYRDAAPDMTPPPH